MTAVVLANVVLAIPFVVAFVAVPLWMTVKRPETGADHTCANSYLRARRAVTLGNDATASAASVPAERAKAA